MANPVWSQIMITIIAMVLSPGVWSQTTGSPPKAVHDGVEKPI